jgi:hypothetical protein
MLTRCLECGNAIRAAHWLCTLHLRARGARVARTTNEHELIRTLVFDFPFCSRYDEFRARVMYAVDVWNSGTRVADIARAHGITVAVTHAVTRDERQSLMCSFIAFVCAHLHLAPASLTETCRDRVRAWYPELICAGSLNDVLRGERMLHVLARATGTRDFLVYADVIIALATVINRDAIGIVYVAYARALGVPDTN